MLERLNDVQIKTLLNVEVGQAIGLSEPLVLAELSPGAIIRAKTKSGTVYLLEVTKPSEAMAHVVRHSEHSEATNSGYRGEHKVATIGSLDGRLCVEEAMHVDRVIIYDNNFTTKIVSLDLIDLSALPII